MRLRIWFPFILMIFLFTACGRFNNEPPAPAAGDVNATPMPPLNPYAPGKGDESLQRGEVYIDSLEIVMSNSFPPDYTLHVKGSLPTPCHQFRDVVDLPTADRKIYVQLYTVFDPDKVCAQSLEPLEASIPLGSYVRGSYTVVVNGQEVGKITP